MTTYNLAREGRPCQESIAIPKKNPVSFELAQSISDENARIGMQEFRKTAIPAEAIARSILFAIEQPDDVDVSEISE